MADTFSEYPLFKRLSFIMLGTYAATALADVSNNTAPEVIGGYADKGSDFTLIDQDALQNLYTREAKGGAVEKITLKARSASSNKSDSVYGHFASRGALALSIATAKIVNTLLYTQHPKLRASLRHYAEIYLEKDPEALLKEAHGLFNGTLPKGDQAARKAYFDTFFGAIKKGLSQRGSYDPMQPKAMLPAYDNGALDATNAARNLGLCVMIAQMAYRSYQNNLIPITPVPWKKQATKTDTQDPFHTYLLKLTASKGLTP